MAARAQARRRRSQAARALALELLAPGPWRLEAAADGRPLALGPDGMPGPDVSLSHSGPWAAAALALDGRIGIDVETPRPGRDIHGIARSWLSPAECRLVAELGEAALLRLWTLREAVAKALGGGVPLALALDGSAILAGHSAAGAAQAWVAAHRQRPGVHLAVAWAVAAPPPQAAATLGMLLDTALDAPLGWPACNP